MAGAGFFFPYTMPSTALQICNAALIKLGAKTITAFTNDRKEAELCSARYPRIRDNILRSHVWAFAKQATTLETDEPSPIVNWDYVHQKPTDLNRIISVTDANDVAVDYELVGTYMHCNEPIITLRYITRYDAIDDAQDFPDDFGEAVAAMLAADLCISLTQTQALRDTYLNEYAVIISQARFNGAVERAPAELKATAWTDVHNGGLLPDYSTLLA